MKLLLLGASLLLGAPACTQDDADHTDTKERLDWLQEAYLRLPADLRETVLLVVAEDMTHAEAGAVLDCAPGTIAWRMSAARKQLKTDLERDHDE